MTPIVVVPKKGRRFRVCGDCKVMINQAMEIDQYPLPKLSNLFATLSGGKSFSKLDLSQAYQQLLLDEQSRKFMTINTQWGLYQYTRLPFGVTSAPVLFQWVMNTVLQGIPGPLYYIDDILVSAKDNEEPYIFWWKYCNVCRDTDCLWRKTNADSFRDQWSTSVIWWMQKVYVPQRENWKPLSMHQFHKMSNSYGHFSA